MSIMRFFKDSRCGFTGALCALAISAAAVATTLAAGQGPPAGQGPAAEQGPAAKKAPVAEQRPPAEEPSTAAASTTLAIYEATGKAEDVGKFKPPTLRNIAVTAPYMHDGSIATLAAVIDHYAAGGRTIDEGPHRGVGHDNPNKSEAIRGFTITSAQRADLVAFLQSLTDHELLRDPRFANPWPSRTSDSRRP